MSFISLDFIIFFIVVGALYFALAQRWRWVLLLGASYFFYGYWNINYIGLILFSTLVDYTAARLIAATPADQIARRHALLLVSIGVNLGVLFTFKYFNFFAGAAEQLAGVFNVPYLAPLLDVLLPVGISFYTFQSMAYTIDVYRGITPAEKHLGIFATYIAFFPQLVAGPIERAPNLLPQFRVTHTFDYDRAVSGLRLILWGAFKKVVIADRLALYVNTVYNDVDAHSGLTLIIATVFFAIQIYCDFSGYSDIAIGSARVLGFNLMLNFRQPYFAASVREHWRRWHISLTTWFRDYVYIPLGGSRVTFARVLVNLLIVFVISGLWHGAAWTFVIWGALHGVFVLIETVVARFSPASGASSGLRRAGGVALTFTLICGAFVFFRANSLTDVAYIYAHIFDFGRGFDGVSAPFAGAFFAVEIEFALAWALIALLLIMDWFDQRAPVTDQIGRLPTPIRWATYYAAATLIAFTFVTQQVSQQFVYFQF